MNADPLRARISLAAVLATVAAVAFWAFFAVSKTTVFSAVIPFAMDPYDAVGSIAIQVALAVGLLGLARLARHRTEPAIPAGGWC